MKCAQTLTEIYKLKDLKFNISKSLQVINMKVTPFSYIFKDLPNDTKYIAI